MPIINQIISSNSIPKLCRMLQNDSGVLNTSTSTPIIDFTGITDIGSYALIHGYTSTSSSILSGNLDLSTIEKLSGTYCMDSCFKSCNGITSVNFSSLKFINGAYALQDAFSSDDNLTTVNMSSLEEVRGGNWPMNNAFSNCNNLTSVDMSSLVCVSNSSGAMRYCFSGCTSLLEFSFSSLKDLSYMTVLEYFFNGCKNITNVYFNAITTTTFGSYKNQFNNMFSSGVIDVTLHFPNNVQSIIESLNGYSTTTPFSAKAGTVLFDLPSTAHLIGVNTIEYERNPKYDTQTALAWRVKDTYRSQSYSDVHYLIDWTPYYTSGITDPQIGDTLYSDSACTTIVTTIDSIA